MLSTFWCTFVAVYLSKQYHSLNFLLMLYLTCITLLMLFFLPPFQLFFSFVQPEVFLNIFFFYTSNFVSSFLFHMHIIIGMLRLIYFKLSFWIIVLIIFLRTYICCLSFSILGLLPFWFLKVMIVT